MRSLNFKNFRIGVILSAFCALAIIILSFIYSKSGLFLILNANLGHFADNFFRFFSYLGDGLFWIPLIVYFIFKQGKKLLPFLISCFILSTLFTQLFKLMLVPGALRPTKFIEGEFIHTVKGVTIHAMSSFPSGHTATAFVFYLIFCLVFKNSWWLIVGLLYAIIVGYSRVYLAQHFPIDVAGGILVAIVSVVFSGIIQNKIYKERTI